MRRNVRYGASPMLTPDNRSRQLLHDKDQGSSYSVQHFQNMIYYG